MPQVPKPHVRAAIHRAALEEFAARGFAGTTMAAVARRAGVAAGSLYRYQRGKEELFEQVVPPELAERLAALVEPRVAALAVLADPDVEPGAVAPGPAEDLLRFWVEHRLATVVLLDRADGTRYEHVGPAFVDQLVSLTEAELVARRGGRPLSPTARLLLAHAFEGSRRAIATILATHEEEAAIRRAVAGFWSYQLAGLRGLAAWVVADPSP